MLPAAGNTSVVGSDIRNKDEWSDYATPGNWKKNDIDEKEDSMIYSTKSVE